MRHLFAEVPEACDNTLLIAERANVEIDFGRPSLPEFPVPDEFVGDTYEVRAAQYLRHLTHRGGQGALRPPDAPPPSSSASTTSSGSSATWASPPTSWWSGT